MKKKKIAIIAAVCVAVIGLGTAAIAGGRAFILGKQMQDLPQGKIIAKVSGQCIYEKDIERTKLTNTEDFKGRIQMIKAWPDSEMVPEWIQQANDLQASDAEILDELIRQKIIVSECKKKGLLVSMEDAIEDQTKTITRMKNSFENGSAEEKERVRDIYQVFLDLCEGTGLSEKEYIRQYAAKSAQVTLSSAKLYQEFIENQYKGSADDTDEKKIKAYHAYIDQLRPQYQIEILASLGTTKNTVSGLDIPSIDTTTSRTSSNRVPIAPNQTSDHVQSGNASYSYNIISFINAPSPSDSQTTSNGR